MRHVGFITALILAAVLLSGVAQAQQRERVLPKEARKRLEHAIGKWSFVTKFYDRSGEVIRELKGTDTNRYMIPGRVVEHTNEIPARQAMSKGLMFYNFQDKRFYMTSVDKNGDLWILSGDLDDYVLTSRPRKRSNGSEMMLRFVHENIQPDSFEAQQEFSRDGGKTWRKGPRQFLRRAKSNGKNPTKATRTVSNTANDTTAANHAARPVLTTMAMRVYHLDKMVSFYHEAFGFKFREVDTQGIKSQFGVLGAMTLKMVPIRDDADFVGYPLHQPGFVVKDVAAIVALAKRYGGRQEGALHRKEGKVVSGAVRDPDGNTVELYLHPDHD